MNKKIILASSSPRRRELLSMLGLKFEVIADNTPEVTDESWTPCEVVLNLAKFKGENVSAKLDKNEDIIIIAADTVVSIDDKILGKPHSEKDAEEMLLKLSGNVHNVYTGVYVKDIVTGKTTEFFEKTQVFFKKLDINEIKDYINTGEPMDKAGAYGIQNFGSLFVERINGDYFNVVGLPISALGSVLRNEYDIKIF